MTGILGASRRAALAAITVLVAAASLVSFGESYRGLYDWAHRHGLHGPWAVAWPLQVDTFIAVGELALFVALADRWKPRSRAAAWAVTLTGLAVSVAGNVGHIAMHSPTDRATAAVPPLAAAAALAVGLGVLKRVVGAHPATVPDPTSDLALVAAEIAAAMSVLAAALRTPLAGPVPRPVHAPRARARSRARKRAPARPAPVTPEAAEAQFAAVLAGGRVPSLRQVKDELKVGTDRARELRGHLEMVTART